MVIRMGKWAPFKRTRTKWDRDDQPTPEALYRRLDDEFHFDFDPCPMNPKGLRKFDGMGEWGKVNFVNPPYSKKEPWLRKAIEEQAKGKLSVFLLPVDTSTAWFHDLILPHAEVRFLRGRVYFNGKPAMFASMLAIYKPKFTVST